jgi:hypothetical protein
LANFQPGDPTPAQPPDPRAAYLRSLPATRAAISYLIPGFSQNKTATRLQKLALVLYILGVFAFWASPSRPGQGPILDLGYWILWAGALGFWQAYLASHHAHRYRTDRPFTLRVAALTWAGFAGLFIGLFGIGEVVAARPGASLMDVIVRAIAPSADPALFGLSVSATLWITATVVLIVAAWIGRTRAGEVAAGRA